jgi:processive 1,2-diacylglycerol beta-glucosyltransferase
LTTSEALARGLVFVIVNPIPGQEERNADHLLEEGAAIRCNNLPVLAYKIDRLLDDHVRLTTMRSNARRLGRPRAAIDIVNRLLALRDEPVDQDMSNAAPEPRQPRARSARRGR